MNLLYAVIISYCGFLVLADDETLELVHVFFRHGARTPEAKDSYPTDPYQADDFMPMGWGQLTNEGKHMSYRLGRNLRKRYDSFLGPIYTPGIVHAMSTDFDRTKMSVLAVLAGLFPPTSSQILEPDLKWMPIPYEYKEEQEDFFLRRPTKYCPAYNKRLQEVLDSDFVKEIQANYDNVFEYVSLHSGKYITTLGEMFAMYQTLTAEAFMNLTLPEWTKSVYPHEIYQMASSQVELENYDHILKRLNGGRSLSFVLENIEAKANGEINPEDRKIYLYSGHENNVANILAAMNVFEASVPEYNGAVMIELHRLPQNESFGIRVLYARDPLTKPVVLRMQDCEEICPLASFIEITKPHIPVNYTAECDSEQYLD